jgi:energy-coupling factor transporter transmembrane protein EcfT
MGGGQPAQKKEFFLLLFFFVVGYTMKYLVQKKDGASAARAVRLYILFSFFTIAGSFFSAVLSSTTRALHCILDPARSKICVSLVQTR